MTRMVDTQKEWARWKYLVMSRSQVNYNALRQLFSGNLWDSSKEEQFRELLAETQRIEPTVGSLQNAYQHVWGYFKRNANDAERAEYKQLLTALTITDDQLKPFLRKLTLKYDISYLLASYLLFPED